MLLLFFQFAANFHLQLFVLWVIIGYFPLVGFSTPAFLVLTIVWSLNDFVLPVNLFELYISIMKRKMKPKLLEIET